MRTWIFYKRKELDSKKRPTFGVDIWKGKRTNVSAEEHEKKVGYITTIAPGKTPKDLAKLVNESGQVVENSERLRIGWNDLIISSSAIELIPCNSYVDIPTTPEEIIEFVEAYRKISGFTHSA